MRFYLEGIASNPNNNPLAQQETKYNIKPLSTIEKPTAHLQHGPTHQKSPAHLHELKPTYAEVLKDVGVPPEIAGGGDEQELAPLLVQKVRRIGQ